MSRSLRNIFFRRLNLLAVVSAAIFGLLLVQAERVILLNDLHNKGESIARILAAVTMDAIMVHDYATVERYAGDIVADPGIVSLTVKRADGEILAAYGGSAGAEHLLTISHPVMMGGEVFGEVSLDFSTERVQSISRKLLLATVAAVIIFHLFGVLISRFALKSAVIMPLEKLSRAIHTLRQGDLDQHIEIREPAEFAELGRSFNEMAATIRNTFDDLGKQRERVQFEQGKLAAIVNNMADGLFVTDTSGVIISFNNSAERITGFSEGEAIGHKCSDLFRSTLCRDACALYHAGEIISNRPTTLTTKGDEIMAVAVSSAMLFDAEGEVVGGVQTFRDITADQKRQEVYCHTEKLAAIGQLAAGLAHEINNPLGNILGYAKYLDQAAPPEEFAKRVAIIIEQTKRCSGIVKGLLDFARRSASRPAVIDPNDLMSRIVDIVRFQADKKDIALHLDLQSAGKIVADPQKIEQVVLNILLNAIQAMSGPGNIWVGTARRVETILLTVADDGPGIAPEVSSRIFDPFFTTKPVGEGTGLGLAISEGIVIEAGGAIDVEDRPGGGAIFTVILPGTFSNSDETLSS
ncbi:MAG: PAS domain-containing protein [Desulfoarculaceae bacterium]|nr:PAS domain-containing protein [Desulfoarculaceae bacterium]